MLRLVRDQFEQLFCMLGFKCQAFLDPEVSSQNERLKPIKRAQKFFCISLALNRKPKPYIPKPLNLNPWGSGRFQDSGIWGLSVPGHSALLRKAHCNIATVKISWRRAEVLSLRVKVCRYNILRPQDGTTAANSDPNSNPTLFGP